MGASGQAGSAMGRPSLRTVAYLPSYRGSLSTWTRQLAFAEASYVNLSFAEIDARGNVSYPDPGLTSFVNAAHAAGVKVCVALGGADTIRDGGVFASLLQDANRSAFVDSLVAYADTHQLDCLDVDLEGNGVNQYYEAFVTELGSKLRASGKEMTAAVASWFGNKVTTLALQSFDFVNIMAYDLHDPSRSEPVQSSSMQDATAEVEYWIGRGLPRERAVFGVPFYGFRFTGAGPEALTYAEILRLDPAAAFQDELVVNGVTIFLNSRATIQAKAQLSQSYGGVMVWELGQDASGEASLLKAIRAAVP